MAEIEGLFSPDGDGLGARLVEELASTSWDRVTAAVAFVKLSGLRYLAGALQAFGAANPGQVSLTVGIDHGGSSIEALADLHTIVSLHGGKLFIAQNPQGSPRPTFHPKMWLFAGGHERLLLVGSGNLTKGGLYSNYESNVCIKASSAEPVIVDAQQFLSHLTDPAQPEVIEATPPLLQRLHDRGDLPSEDESRRLSTASNSLRRSHGTRHNPAPVFVGRAVTVPNAPGMPPLPARAVTIRQAQSYAPSPSSTTGTPAVAASTASPRHRFFFITVRMAEKTEVYLAKRPLDEDPAYFGAPFRGLTTPHGAGVPQPQADPPPRVRIELHTSTPVVIDHHDLKLWTYTYGTSANGDFRTNFTAALQQQIDEDSVVRFERDPVARPDLQYLIDIFPPSHADYAAMMAKCISPLTNSVRRYGWE